jgi:hypothetical protein
MIDRELFIDILIKLQVPRIMCQKRLTRRPWLKYELCSCPPGLCYPMGPKGKPESRDNDGQATC